MIVRYALDCGTRVLAPRKRGELAPIMRSYLGTRASGPPITPRKRGGGSGPDHALTRCYLGARASGLPITPPASGEEEVAPTTR